MRFTGVALLIYFMPKIGRRNDCKFNIWDSMFCFVSQNDICLITFLDKRPFGSKIQFSRPTFLISHKGERKLT